MIVGVNVAQRQAVTDDDVIVPVEVLFDGDGDETESTDEARFAIGPLPDGRWFLLDLGEFEEREPH